MAVKGTWGVGLDGQTLSNTSSATGILACILGALQGILAALTGGGGGAAENVAITGPLGPQTAAASVAVVQTGAGNFAVTPVTAADDGTATLAARTNRRAVTVTNLSTSPETIWFGPATGVSNTTGMQLAAGQSMVVDTTAAVFFYGAAGTGTINCVETYG
ncbi:MAG: hypothetical protein WBD81_18025 [Collimonas pratensis]|uniref:hypothetical protein n=1 Tax=Collimonas pratensis TaxID=279113 RepID=UPI003C771D41